MLSTVELDYIQHLERGYCENHPDVIAQTKDQVVDRAVKQLLTALQSNGFELDGNVLKRGNGWLQYDATASAWQYSNDAGVTWLPMTQGTMPIIGEIRMLSHATLPAGWMLCDGQTVLRSSALGQIYTAHGYPFGAGDGLTTCNIPDLRDRFPFGFGLTNTVLGNPGGQYSVTIPVTALPSHVHALDVPYSSAAGTGASLVRGGTGEGYIYLTAATTGQGKPFSCLPPYLVINFMVYGG